MDQGWSYACNRSSRVRQPVAWSLPRPRLCTAGLYISAALRRGRRGPSTTSTLSRGGTPNARQVTVLTGGVVVFDADRYHPHEAEELAADGSDDVGCGASFTWRPCGRHHHVALGMLLCRGQPQTPLAHTDVFSQPR